MSEQRHIVTLEVVVHARPDEYTIEDIQNTVNKFVEETFHPMSFADITESVTTTMEM